MENGEFVILTDQDFEKARTPSTQLFEIRDFVKADDIEPRFFDHPYFVAPAGKPTAKAYALLRDALAESGHVGVGKVVIREREHLAALHPSREALILTTMRFADELRSTKGLDLPAQGKGWTKKEMGLARSLIGSLESAWKPQQYTDEYEAVLRDVIEKKAKGEKIVSSKLERPRTIRNLAQALQKSLAQPRRHLTMIDGGRRNKATKAKRTAARRQRHAKKAA